MSRLLIDLAAILGEKAPDYARQQIAERGFGHDNRTLKGQPRANYKLSLSRGFGPQAYTAYAGILILMAALAYVAYGRLTPFATRWLTSLGVSHAAVVYVVMLIGGGLVLAASSLIFITAWSLRLQLTNRVHQWFTASGSQNRFDLDVSAPELKALGMAVKSVLVNGRSVFNGAEIFCDEQEQLVLHFSAPPPAKCRIRVTYQFRPTPASLITEGFFNVMSGVGGIAALVLIVWFVNVFV